MSPNRRATGIAAMLTLLLGACSTQSAELTGIDRPDSTPPSAAPPTVAASSATTEKSATANPYSLTIPKPRPGYAAFSRIGGGFSYQYLRNDNASDRGTLTGACIYGVDDELTYQVLGTTVRKAGPQQEIFSGSIYCDGAVHTTRFTSRFHHTSAQITFGEAGDKTKGYLRLTRTPS